MTSYNNTISYTILYYTILYWYIVIYIVISGSAPTHPHLFGGAIAKILGISSGGCEKLMYLGGPSPFGGTWVWKQMIRGLAWIWLLFSISIFLELKIFACGGLLQKITLYFPKIFACGGHFQNLRQYYHEIFVTSSFLNKIFYVILSYNIPWISWDRYVFSENALMSGFDEVRRDRDVGGICTLSVLGGTLMLGGT